MIKRKKLISSIAYCGLLLNPVTKSNQPMTSSDYSIHNVLEEKKLESGLIHLKLPKWVAKMLGLCGWVQLNSRFTQPTVRAFLRETITVYDLI